MQITINVECTPEEARAFFGMPDVQPMQRALLNELQDRMTANIRAMDPAELFRTLMPASVEGFKRWQEMFTSQAQPKE
jgi:hypothetical protein